MMPPRAAAPNASFGYWRGGGEAQGSGSGMGQANQGAGLLGQGIGAIGGNGGWEPSVLYLLGLVVIEMIAFHLIGRLLK